MQRAGYCSGCERNIWLDEAGRCPAGHPAECVSGVYQVPEAASQIAGPKTPKWLVPLLVAVIVVLLGATATMAVMLARSSSRTPGAAALKPAAPKRNPPQRFDRSSWAVLDADPNAYPGSTFDVYALVEADPVHDQGSTVVDIIVDPQNDQWPALIRLPKGAPSIKRGDGLHVTGKVFGEYDYKDGSGRQQSILTLDATSAVVVDVRKPLRVIQNVDSQSQHGVKVKITRVEYGFDSTRVFVTVENHATFAVGFYAEDHHLEQANVTLNVHDDEKGYPQVSESIPPGKTSSGVLVFDPIPPEKEASVVISPFNDTDDSVSFEDMTFALPAGAVTSTGSAGNGGSAESTY